MEKHVELKVFVKKGTNRFITEDYYKTTVFDMGYINPMVFFRPMNWHILKKRISSMYGIRIEDMGYIKSKIKERFLEDPHVISMNKLEEYSERRVLAFRNIK